MRQFFKDLLSTLYSPAGGMSLFRLAFAISFIVFVCIACADFCVPSHNFNHYGEFAAFVGALGGLACGSKVVDMKGGSENAN